MKIGVLVASVGNFGQKGYYNLQEIGLAKALAKLASSVTIYKFVSKEQPPKIEIIDGCKNVSINFIPTYHIGTNGIVTLDIMKDFDTSIDVLINFADVQLFVPEVFLWCKKNKVRYIPYIGVIESHSSNKIIRTMTNILSIRNIAIYKKDLCFVKNEDVQKQVLKKGIKKVELAPIGIDLGLLNREFEKSDINELKEKYGFNKDDKIILFIGRIEEEKRPVDLIEYFEEINKKGNKYKLLIVGKGNLFEQMQVAIKEKKLSEKIVYIEKIPNNEIWELYRISECFVNLNKQEIFGMVLLEAMFYKTKIVAWHAPGPDYIIEDRKSGYLVSSKEEFIDCVFEENSSINENAHSRLINELTWDKTAKIIMDEITI